MKQGIHIGTSRQIIVCLHLLVDYLAIVAAEHTALWLQGMFRVEASRMMVLPWEYRKRKNIRCITDTKRT